MVGHLFHEATTNFKIMMFYLIFYVILLIV